MWQMRRVKCIPQGSITNRGDSITNSWSLHYTDFDSKKFKAHVPSVYSLYLSSYYFYPCYYTLPQRYLVVRQHINHPSGSHAMNTIVQMIQKMRKASCFSARPSSLPLLLEQLLIRCSYLVSLQHLPYHGSQLLFLPLKLQSTMANEFHFISDGSPMNLYFPNTVTRMISQYSTASTNVF